MGLWFLGLQGQQGQLLQKNRSANAEEGGKERGRERERRGGAGSSRQQQAAAGSKGQGQGQEEAREGKNKPRFTLSTGGTYFEYHETSV